MGGDEPEVTVTEASLYSRIQRSIARPAWKFGSGLANHEKDGLLPTLHFCNLTWHITDQRRLNTSDKTQLSNTLQIYQIESIQVYYPPQWLWSVSSYHFVLPILLDWHYLSRRGPNFNAARPDQTYSIHYTLPSAICPLFPRKSSRSIEIFLPCQIFLSRLDYNSRTTRPTSTRGNTIRSLFFITKTSSSGWKMMKSLLVPY
jgi:hypothetical protein